MEHSLKMCNKYMENVSVLNIARMMMTKELTFEIPRTYYGFLNKTFSNKISSYRKSDHCSDRFIMSTDGNNQRNPTTIQEVV